MSKEGELKELIQRINELIRTKNELIKEIRNRGALGDLSGGERQRLELSIEEVSEEISSLKTRRAEYLRTKKGREEFKAIRKGALSRMEGNVGSSLQEVQEEFMKKEEKKAKRESETTDSEKKKEELKRLAKELKKLKLKEIQEEKRKKQSKSAKGGKGRK